MSFKEMPKLGFGLMRLPEKDGAIDMEAVQKMVDAYMGSGFNYLDTAEKYDCFQWAMEKKEKGQIRHFGFSYHGSPELLEQVLDKHPEVEFVQIQMNYADWNNQVVQSGKLYEILHRRGIPMIIMEPVKGGTLANLQPELEAMLKEVRPDASAASWALRFVGSLDGVMTILSGMSTQEQMADNLNTFRNFEPLTKQEKQVIQAVVQKNAGYAHDPVYILPLLL